MPIHPSNELRTVLLAYDLGELVAYQADRRGTVNTSYIIDTDKEGKSERFFVRRYRAGITIQDLHFEHGLIQHLAAKRFPYIARLIPTRSGSSYVTIDGGAGRHVFYAIFEFLQGEDRYTWINPRLSQREVQSAGEVLAKYHLAAWDHIPGAVRVEPKIAELLPQVRAKIVAFHSNSNPSVFDQYLKMHSARLLKHIDGVLDTLHSNIGPDFFQLPIHCDYHPGNLKFAGQEVVGLYDFDWSKVDLRVFDLGLALFYFVAEWQEGEESVLRLDQVSTFVGAYQNTLLETHGVLQPMSASELRVLGEMVIAGTLYVLNWALEDYMHKDVDSDEYHGYLSHCVEVLRWFESKEHELAFIEHSSGGF